MSALIEKIVAVSRANPGMVSREIATQLGCRDAYVRTVWQQQGIERSSGNRGAKPPQILLRRITISNSAYRRFLTEAAERGVTVEGLLNAVIDAVAKDNLFRAVLDD